MEYLKNIENLAKAAFEAQERVRIMGMVNTPDKYEDRAKAYIEMAKARAIATEATRLLNQHID